MAAIAEGLRFTSTTAAVKIIFIQLHLYVYIRVRMHGYVHVHQRVYMKGMHAFVLSSTVDKSAVLTQSPHQDIHPYTHSMRDLCDASVNTPSNTRNKHHMGLAS